LAKEECSIESHFCTKECDAMWVYMFQRMEKRRQGKNLNEQSCDQFNSTTTIFLKWWTFQNTLKIIWKKKIIL